MIKICEAEKRRLLYQCRRGMLELDVILLPFFESAQHERDEEWGRGFSRFLNEADPDLYTWLMGYGSPEDEGFRALVHEIRQFNRRLSDA